MNILPKKSWHVRNKDNVARVRRDEAQAAEEERQRGKRAELAEQEARTDFLRKKARSSLPETSTARSTVVEVYEESGHINLFQDVQEGKGTTHGNKEYEEEKRREKERQEKALGILTYLGQSAAEAQTCRPWYQEVPVHHKKEEDDTAKDEKLKRMLDPMTEMEKYLHKKSGEKKRPSDKKEHKKGKEKGKDKKGGSKPSMEQLRQERLKREAAERARAEALLSGRKDQPAPEQEMDDRKRRYHSQFNPQLARKPKLREEHW
ncbi:leukocyte receptor cluster member 1 [Bufo gargarizans]|uniref:leukocyte receptor cluster member 1 n=1 Tax=Bufo gargarizans TaxID=30331 RepID=UPI001CF46B88|nr:leukocyte receptor cluster member 1 [Bufo gargarizans]